MIKKKRLILTLIYWQISNEKHVPKHLILKIITPKWTIIEDFKYWIRAVDDQICTVNTSDRSQMNPKKILNNTAISVQLPYTPFKDWWIELKFSALFVQWDTSWICLSFNMNELQLYCLFTAYKIKWWNPDNQVLENKC